jgi:integrase
MSVRKRKWRSADGEIKHAWVVDYVGITGKRHTETFERKKEADDRHAAVKVEVSRGVHIADADSISVEQAGKLWLETADNNRLERATVDEYRRHLDTYISPHLGAAKLSRLTVPMVTDFRSKLRVKHSPAMVKKIISSLSGIVADAQERGLVAQNVVRSLTNRKKKLSKAEQRRKLRVGVDIPTPDEIKAIIGKLDGRWRPLFLTAIFTGLRASELRGLRWADVDLKKGVVQVRQRADKYNAIGAPKSEAGERSVPLPPIVVVTLREWKLTCPKGDLGLVFPNGSGNVENRGNIINRGFVPAQIAAGVADPVLPNDGRATLDGDGNPVLKARYPGLHALRHFYASWCINCKVDGGLELPAKIVQQRLGHSSIVMTMDTYGHLFASGDDGAALAEAERALFGI